MQAGCGRVFADTASGAASDRPGLARALEHLRAGDTLVVWKLDRLGRSLPHLIETIARLHEEEVGFKSLTEQIDTTTRVAVAIRKLLTGARTQLVDSVDIRSGRLIGDRSR